MTIRRVLATAAFLVPHLLRAQAGGPYAPLVLQLPAGARALSMGNVGVASRDDDVLFYNPAQLVIARGMSASAERYSATSAGGTLSAVTRFNGGGIAVGMRMVDYDAPAGGGAFPADRLSMLGAAGATATSLEASIGVAQVYKGLRVGIAAKYAEETAIEAHVGRGALDVGLSKDFLRYFTAGLAVQNIGQSMAIPTLPTDVSSANLPLRTTLGLQASHAVGEFDLVATGAVSMLRSDFVVPAGGAELGYSWLDGYSIALRAGARRGLPGEGTLTAGAGFTVDRLSVDYAVETLGTSRVGHRVGIRVR
jgi:hypothetical protein